MDGAQAYEVFFFFFSFFFCLMLSRLSYYTVCPLSDSDLSNLCLYMLRQTLLFWRFWFPTTTHISDDMDLLCYYLLDLVRCTFTT